MKRNVSHGETDVPRPGTARAVGSATCVALLTIAVQLPIFDRWFSVMDEGHMLLFADLVTQGHQLYSDMTIYPLPGAFYLLAAAFRIFDPSILVSRWLVVVEFAVLVAVVFSLMRRVVSLRYACAAVFAMWLYRVWAFPHWQMFNYSSTALVFLFGSLATLVAHFESGRRHTLWAAGLLFGLGVFCKQDYGAATLFAASVSMVVYARSSHVNPVGTFAHFLWPAATVGALAGIHFLIQGQLGFVVQMTVLKHFAGLSAYEYQAFPELFPLFSQDPTLRSIPGVYNFFPTIVSVVDAGALRSDWFLGTSLYDTGVKLYVYGPIALVACGLIRCGLHRDRLDDDAARIAYLAELTLVVFAAAGVALVHSYRPQDYVHFAVLYWPLLLVVIVQAHALLHTRRRLTWLVAVALLLPIGAATAYTGRLVVQLRESFDEPLGGKRAGIYARPEQVRMMEELVAYIREHSEPDEPVAVLPYFSIAHFLAERHGPHAASYIVWPFPEYPDRDQRIVDAMESHEIGIVIYTHTQFPNFPPFSEYAPIVYDYLVEHFETDRTFGDDPLGFKLTALRRKGPVGSSSPLQPEIGTLRIESDSKRMTPIRLHDVTGHLAATIWPFRNVWAMRPTANGRTVLSVPLQVPNDARLETAVGVHPDAWFQYPGSWVRFSIDAVREGRRDELYRRTLDPHHRLSDRGWFDVDVPLDPYAGQRIELEFSTETATPNGQLLEMAAFAVPRVGSEPRE